MTTNSPRIDLVYHSTCPNVQAARAALRTALDQVSLPPVWTEWNSMAESTPVALQGFGSPTVLIDGRDVLGVRQMDAASAGACRVYFDGEGRALGGAPSVQMIVSVLTSGLEGDFR